MTNTQSDTHATYHAAIERGQIDVERHPTRRYLRTNLWYALSRHLRQHHGIPARRFNPGASDQLNMSTALHLHKGLHE